MKYPQLDELARSYDMLELARLEVGDLFPSRLLQQVSGWRWLGEYN